MRAKHILNILRLAVSGQLNPINWFKITLFELVLLYYLKTKINEVIRIFASFRRVRDLSDDIKMWRN